MASPWLLCSYTAGGPSSGGTGLEDMSELSWEEPGTGILDGGSFPVTAAVLGAPSRKPGEAVPRAPLHKPWV